MDKLTHPPLKYQSKYNSFLFTVEISDAKEKSVKLFGKKLPQDSQMVPRSGIKVIRDNIEFDAVGAAEYRIESIKFDEILRGLQVYLAKVPQKEKLSISKSWDKLRDSIESLPNRSKNFPKMKLDELPQQPAEVLQVPDYLLEEEDDGMELTGQKYPEKVDEGDLDSDLEVGMDIAIYTEEQRGRPWVGRVLSMSDEKRFIVHWFTRKTIRSTLFQALTNSDGSPNVSELENGCIMFWQMSENRTKTSFTLNSFWLENIEIEYQKLDKC